MNILFSIMAMEWSIMIDMDINAVSIILMYAMYHKEYLCLCGCCDRAVKKVAECL